MREPPAQREQVIELPTRSAGVDHVAPRRRAIERSKQLARLTSALGTCALLLAVTGLAGLVSFTVSQRLKEIGIRVALGARPRQIVSVVARQFTRPLVAGLLAVLIKAVRDIESSSNALLEVAGKVGANTANIPQLEATAPVLGLIVDEAIVQDGYMDALTDGYGAGVG